MPTHTFTRACTKHREGQTDRQTDLEHTVASLRVQALVSEGVRVLHGLWKQVDEQLLFDHTPYLTE